MLVERLNLSNLFDKLSNNPVVFIMNRNKHCVLKIIYVFVCVIAGAINVKKIATPDNLELESLE